MDIGPTISLVIGLATFGSLAAYFYKNIFGEGD